MKIQQSNKEPRFKNGARVVSKAMGAGTVLKTEFKGDWEYVQVKLDTGKERGFLASGVSTKL